LEPDQRDDFKVSARPVMSKAAKLDKLMEKRRFGDEYMKPADNNPFRPKAD
jgi:hypothetical protein